MNKKPDKQKPAKPYPEFPLTANGNGYWSKKIQGKVHYFGKWDDWEGALKRYEQFAPPAPTVEGNRLRDMCNAFMTAKMAEVEARRNRHHYMARLRPCVQAADECPWQRLRHYNLQCATLCNSARTPRSKVPKQDHARGKTHKTACSVQLVNENELLDRQLMFKAGLKKPSERLIRKEKNDAGTVHFTNKQVLEIMRASNGFIRVCVHLAINCGFGNTDCCNLKWEHIKGNWIELTRNKTQITRRCRLWDSTRAVLHNWKYIAPKHEYIAGFQIR